MAHIVSTLWMAIPFYLDPGSGSFIIQLILAGALGLGVGVRLYWAKIKSLFGGKKHNSEQPAGESQDED